ncbi:MAG: Tripartite ATP-independent periplasmic transporter, DctQ component [Betaproteobacteria bacterium]|jgi:TRAP-type C4-dicarboxylate transport system permease small subunit|nr:Tripartite ATP-independent periplasmic transporter, DctQ component [Betaproteobacteria bacterium]
MLRSFERGCLGAFAGLSLALPALVLLILYQVIGRLTDFGNLSWIEDVCRLILLWTGLLFVPALQWKEEHIAVQLFRPPTEGVRRALIVLRHAAFLVLGLTFLYLGSVNVVRERGMTGAGGMELPLEFFNLVIPICGLLVTIVAVLKLIRVLRRREAASLVP